MQQQQYGAYGPIPQRPSPFGYAHPILIIGVFVFVLPFLLGWGSGSVLTWLGIILILIGSGFSIARAADR